MLICLGTVWLSHTSPGLNQCCSTQGWERMSPLNRIIPVFCRPGSTRVESALVLLNRVEPVLVDLVHQ